MVEETKALHEASQQGLQCSFDFQPGNVGLIKSLRVSFAAKRTKIQNFIAKTRKHLAAEKSRLDQEFNHLEQENAPKLLEIARESQQLDKAYTEHLKNAELFVNKSNSNNASKADQSSL